jgi:hypothetical protein
MDEQSVTDDTRRWVRSIVIGLNLCPFACRVFEAGLVRYVVTAAGDAEALHSVLAVELRALALAPISAVETTLLIHPHALTDFLAYSDFLADGDRLVKRLGLRGVIQIASFHPDYCFAGADPGAVENYTNRSPYPMLHLLREESVTRATADMPQVSEIPGRNAETLRRLGIARVVQMLTPR